MLSGAYQLEHVCAAGGIIDREPDGLRIVTPEGRWQYAATFPPAQAQSQGGAGTSGPGVVRLLVSVRAGQIGFGCLRMGLSSF